jgi:hypothetical protein
MTQTTQTTALYVGIDGSQKTLTIAPYPTDAVWTLANDPHHHRALVQHLAQLSAPRVLLRQLLYQAAVVAKSHDARWGAVYEGLVGRGKAKKVALCAVARRLLVVLNAMVRDGRAYARV